MEVLNVDDDGHGQAKADEQESMQILLVTALASLRKHGAIEIGLDEASSLEREFAAGATGFNVSIDLEKKVMRIVLG